MGGVSLVRSEGNGQHDPRRRSARGRVTCRSSFLILQGNTLVPFQYYKQEPSFPSTITRKYPRSLLTLHANDPRRRSDRGRATCRSSSSCVRNTCARSWRSCSVARNSTAHSLLVFQGNTLIPFYYYKGLLSFPSKFTRDSPPSLLMSQGIALPPF